jgi:hypothetical protein
VKRRVKEEATAVKVALQLTVVRGVVAAKTFSWFYLRHQYYVKCHLEQ